MHSAFGKLLREYRLAQGLSQESLAERASMSVNGISALERGANQSPQRKTLELLVKALRLGPEQSHALEQAATRPSRPRPGASETRFEDVTRSATPFFGRRELLDEVQRLIMELPLVTLTGPGGIGKTRLALKVAEESIKHFSDGLVVLDLAPLHDGESVLRTLGAHFGVKATGEEPLLAKVVEALRAKNLLLLIDNCEHVTAAVASAVQALIRGCPAVRIIATSRQPLKVPGEQVVRVPALDLESSIELFVERAKRASGPAEFSAGDIEIIARIVLRLDGIALAIELAAARINLLTLSELEHHLSERFHILTGGSAVTLPRQQTMRATMDWSYDLLSPRERQVFGRLRIFPASFSLDAAVAVCGDEQTGKWQVFEALASLVEKSLVNSAPEGGVQRYTLLETTRAYVSERMSDGDETAALRRRHAVYYCRLGESAAAALESTESTVAWARALEPDLENFRTALSWLLAEDGDCAAGVRLLANLQELWIVEGSAAETARRAHEVLNLKPGLPNALRAALWLTIARMRQELFVHPGHMLEAASKARELFEVSEDRSGLALAVRQQAAAHMRLGEFSQAQLEFERSLEIYRDLGDQRMAARGLGYLASLLQVKGEYAQARAMLADVLGIAKSIGDDRMMPTIAINLAETEFALGDAEGAAVRARENLSDPVLLKSSDMIATQEANLAVYLLALGRAEEARAMALASIEDAGGSFVAVPLQHLAASLAISDPVSASRILGYVDQAFKATAFSRENTERFSYEYLTGALRAAVQADALAKYRGEGAAMSQQQILAIACSAAEPLPPFQVRI
jgi:predicted ATPase/DNA-binding XRE family transcriptional regulator